MSFSAVTALVVTYQSWQKYRPAYRKFLMGKGAGKGAGLGNGYSGSYRQKFVNFLSSLTVTSFVAGGATSAFAVFHFNRIARYSMVGNLLAMPIFSLAVMPLALISLLALPLGLERWPLWAMGQAMSFILWVAEWTARLEGAWIYAHAAQNYVLPIFAAGFTALCLGRAWVRWLGLAVMAVCLGLWSQAPTPDLRVSADGQVAIWSGENLLTDNSRADRFGREQFERQSGRVGAEWLKFRESGAACDALACRLEIKGRLISVLRHPSEVSLECKTADIVILSVRAAGPIARRGCKAELIDARSLGEGGAVSLYLGKTNSAEPKIRLVKSKSRSRNRPWSSGRD
jgi:competence protein ComEC